MKNKCPECNSEDFEVYQLTKDIEYHCNNCKCSWVLSKDGVRIAL